MRATFPYMGTMHIPIKTLLEELGLEVIVPPPPTKTTLKLGIQHSPEFACLPLKIGLGNYLEALALGADTIIMCGGKGPCRLGYYAQVQEEILRDLGYRCRMIVLEPDVRDIINKVKILAPDKSWGDVYRAIKLCWHKMQAVDRLEQLAMHVRAREVNRGQTTRVLNRGLEAIAAARDHGAIEAARLQGEASLLLVRVDLDRQPLQVGIVGELYVVLEPFVNQDLDKLLGEMGVHVRRTIFLSAWVQHHLLKFMHQRERALLEKDARPYLKHWVGGHGLETVARTVRLAREGFDGVIHVLPFTCMPEIVAKGILPRVSEDYDLPVMSLVLDEHAAEAGLMTRLEAYVDLLHRRRREKEAKQHARISWY